MFEHSSKDPLDDVDYVNQLNRLRVAAKSTGPKTPEGKAVSSQNARKHGLCAKIAVGLDPDERAEFEEYRRQMLDCLEPTDAVQATLAHRVIETSWRLKRVCNVEAAMVRTNIEYGKGIGASFTQFGMMANFMKLSNYERNIERSMYDALQRLGALQRAGRSVVCEAK